MIQFVVGWPFPRSELKLPSKLNAFDGAQGDPFKLFYAESTESRIVVNAGDTKCGYEDRCIKLERPIDNTERKGKLALLPIIFT